MGDYEEEVKKLQAEARQELQRILAASNEQRPDSFRAERRLFAHELAMARLTRKLSQSELAARIGSRQPAISRIENGKGNPSLNTLLEIAKALDINLVIEYKD